MGTAKHILDQLKLGTGTVDAVNDYTIQLAGATLASITGLTIDDAIECRRCLMLTDAITDEEPTSDRRQLVVDSIRNQHAVFRRLVDERKRAPRDDFVSILASNDGSIDVNGAMYIIAAASYEPAGTLATAILLLSRAPDLRQQLIAKPSLTSAFVEEVLRYAGSTLAAVRMTTRETELCSIRIPAGSMVLLLLGSANRDEEQFPDPDSFILDRHNIKTHLAFGHGAHYCLGSHLTRLQMEVGVQQWLQFAADFDCPPTPELNWFGRGAFRTLQALPVTVR